MPSTWKQRFYREEREFAPEGGRTGTVHMLCVALNYEGSDAPLGCVVDCERMAQMAKKFGVNNIVKIYDNGKTKTHPCIDEVKETMKHMASCCKPGDQFVLQYSGHGMNQENPEEASGYDCMFCLTKRGGEEDYWLDDDFTNFVLETFHPKVKLLFMVDACHSAGILDFVGKKRWKGRRVCVLSGCQDTQCSNDTGDGGAMTLALLKVLRQRKVTAHREKGKASIQYIFNRMVEEMPEDEEEEEEEELGEFEEDTGDYWEDGAEENVDEGEDDEEAVNGDEDEEGDDEPEPGQTINLAWSGTDPTELHFPF